MHKHEPDKLNAVDRVFDYDHDGILNESEKNLEFIYLNNQRIQLEEDYKRRLEEYRQSELVKRQQAAQADKIQNDYLNSFYDWKNKVSNVDADEEAYDIVQKYYNDHFLEMADFKTPAVIDTIFQNLKSYDKSRGHYPFGGDSSTAKELRKKIEIERFRMLSRLKLLEIGMINTIDAEEGISTDTYFSFSDYHYRQIMHEFFCWYDDQLWKTGIGYPMMFLSKEYEFYSPERKVDLCIQVAEMKEFDEGIYFWFPNRHVAGLA